MNLQIFFASFAGTGVEFLETAVIAYALARTGCIGEAIVGTVLGNLLIALPAYFAWPWLARIPIHLFQCGVGVLLLWLGGSCVGELAVSDCLPEQAARCSELQWSERIEFRKPASE